jgi:hypothetical protein
MTREDDSGQPSRDERPTPHTPATSPTVHGNEESDGLHSPEGRHNLGDMLPPISAEEARAWGWNELHVCSY